MIGFYYLPKPILAHETGMTLEEASKALQCLSEVDFAYYDEDSEHVFVPNMAKFQIDDRLELKDKRVISIRKQLEPLRKTLFFNQFLNRYREAFHLQGISPFEGPSKPLRSQEKEQEQKTEHSQEKEQDKDQNISVSVVPTSRRLKGIKASSAAKTALIREAYSSAYKIRYGAEPLINASVNGILSRLVDRLGSEVAPGVAAFYVQHNDPFYVNKRHPVNLMLRDAEGLHTQWITGVKSTTRESKNAEHRDNVTEQVRRVSAQLQQERGGL